MGTWNRTVPNLAIFDDAFVAENVYAGLSIHPEQRQRLNEVILGDQGVALNETLNGLAQRIEDHNRTLRALAEAIPSQIRNGLTIDAFCALQQNLQVEAQLEEAARALAAVNETA
jgi:hypothetical protein